MSDAGALLAELAYRARGNPPSIRDVDLHQIACRVVNAADGIAARARAEVVERVKRRGEIQTDDRGRTSVDIALDDLDALATDTEQRGRDSDMKCPSCGALAEVPGHYSWCKAQPSDSASEEQDEGRTPDQSWIVALHNLRICADELHRIGHGGEARMIEDAVNRIVAFRQHIAARARAEVVEKIEMRRDEIIDMRPADRPPTIRTLNGIIRALVSPTTEEE